LTSLRLQQYPASVEANNPNYIVNIGTMRSQSQGIGIFDAVEEFRSVLLCLDQFQQREQPRVQPGLHHAPIQADALRTQYW
jgi:hypothetical protein